MKHEKINILKKKVTEEKKSDSSRVVLLLTILHSFIFFFFSSVYRKKSVIEFRDSMKLGSDYRLGEAKKKKKKTEGCSGYIHSGLTR